jgi:hypothetical protein
MVDLPLAKPPVSPITYGFDGSNGTYLKKNKFTLKKTNLNLTKSFGK